MHAASTEIEARAKSERPKEEAEEQRAEQDRQDAERDRGGGRLPCEPRVVERVMHFLQLGLDR
jgi:hypothetical protein